MDEILKKLDEQDKKIDAIYGSVEKTRKYYLITLYIGIAFFVVPLISLLFVLPQFFSAITGSGLVK